MAPPLFVARFHGDNDPVSVYRRIYQSTIYVKGILGFIVKRVLCNRLPKLNSVSAHCSLTRSVLTNGHIGIHRSSAYRIEYSSGKYHVLAKM